MNSVRLPLPGPISNTREGFAGRHLSRSRIRRSRPRRRRNGTLPSEGEAAEHRGALWTELPRGGRLCSAWGRSSLHLLRTHEWNHQRFQSCAPRALRPPANRGTGCGMDSKVFHSPRRVLIGVAMGSSDKRDIRPARRLRYGCPID